MRRSAPEKLDEIDLRLGDWREVLADVKQVDAVITDPPYSDRTHAGQRTGSSIRAPTIAYSQLTASDAMDMAESWAPRTRFWALMFGDHSSMRMHEEAWRSVGWYTFSPVAWVPNVVAPRFSGDGPACGLEYILVARPRHRIPSDRTGSRPGVYRIKGAYSCDVPSGISGHKNLDGMKSIIRDYTLPGDLVVDLCAGLATTLIAAAEQGRRAVGAEIDPDTFAKAQLRIKRGYTVEMFPGAA